MTVCLIIICEAAFWAVLAAGLTLRYLSRHRALGGAVLLCVPLVDLGLLAATAAELRRGGTAGWSVGLAAVYLGFSAGYGRTVVRWADARFAHRFAGGPRPVAPPRYGAGRARHEWSMFRRTLVSAAVAAALLEAVRLAVADGDRTRALTGWFLQLAAVTAVHLVVAVSYVVFPKRPSAA